MKTRMERILGRVIFVVVLLALAAMINYYFWQRQVKLPVSEVTTTAISGQPEVSVAAQTNRLVSVTGSVHAEFKK